MFNNNRDKLLFNLSLQDVIFVDEINNESTIMIPKPSKSVSAISNPNKSVTFSFDRCYNSTSTTAHIYNELPYSLVEVNTFYSVTKNNNELLSKKS